MAPDLRPATPEDAEGAHAVFMAGFETYRSFAAPGWEPPHETVDEMRERLVADGGWGVVGTEHGEIVAFGAYEPARGDDRNPRIGPRIEGLAHVWAVFVAEPHWGTGAATAVLAALTGHMRDAGFAEGRLYTPAGQARARRFYAREGWVEPGEPFRVEALGLDLVELRVRL